MIDFELSEEQQMIRDTVGAFAIEQMRPAARAADETGTVAARAHREAMGTRGGGAERDSREVRRRGRYALGRHRRRDCRGAWLWRYRDCGACAGAEAVRISDSGSGYRCATRALSEAVRRAEIRCGDRRADGAAVRFRSHHARDLRSSRGLGSRFSTGANAWCRSRPSRSRSLYTRPRMRMRVSKASMDSSFRETRRVSRSASARKTWDSRRSQLTASNSRIAKSGPRRGSVARVVSTFRAS